DMIDRRRFVQQGAVAIALAGGTFRLARAGDSLGHPPIRLHSALFDRRFTAARRFARAMGTQGIPTHTITGDVTSIWFNRLQPLWKRQPVAIAGLTTYAPLFCLERLAWDHGMRVLQRVQQESRAAGEPDQLLYSWV